MTAERNAPVLCNLAGLQIALTVQRRDNRAAPIIRDLDPGTTIRSAGTSLSLFSKKQFDRFDFQEIIVVVHDGTGSHHQQG